MKREPPFPLFESFYQYEIEKIGIIYTTILKFQTRNLVSHQGKLKERIQKIFKEVCVTKVCTFFSMNEGGIEEPKKAYFE